ncbi:MAG TPA: transcription termination/antitermination NusG family protein [Opitutaceae bacterium]|nr:transcription termination/antitermination NusG family protein [Opitutaceae bacterium]
MNTIVRSVASPSWFCLRTQPKREHVAAVNLRKRVQIEVFAPRLRIWRSTRHGIASLITEALFPGYIFARFLHPDQSRHVLSTTGITGIVAFDGRPPAVADPVIDFLRNEIEQAGRNAGEPLLEEGSWVRIATGCFHDMEGRVLHFDPQAGRVRLLLMLLGRTVRVNLPARGVTFASAPHAHYPPGLLARPEMSA